MTKHANDIDKLLDSFETAKLRTYNFVGVSSLIKRVWFKTCFGVMLALQGDYVDFGGSYDIRHHA